MRHHATPRPRGLSGFSPLLLAAIAMAVALALPAPSAAQQEEDAALSTAKGRITFRVYCVNCHGPAAKGDGALAELLTVQPADLTALAKNNDGEFPEEHVAKTIDGRGEVRGHGMRDMPIWGDAFQTSTLEPSGGDEEGLARARRKIVELVMYLRSIQEK